MFRLFLLLPLFLASFSIDALATNQYISHYVFSYIDNDKPTVIKYLTTNADTNADAAYILGVLYLENNNESLSNKYIDIAALHGHNPAINAVGDRYYSCKKDISTALKYYKKAAKNGYGPSQFQTGIIYLKHKKDYKKAKYWLNLASKNTRDLDESIRKAAAMYAQQHLK